MRVFFIICSKITAKPNKKKVNGNTTATDAEKRCLVAQQNLK